MFIQIGNTTDVLFVLFLFLHWYVLSPRLILPLNARIIFKSLKEVSKQTTFRNVKRDNGSSTVQFNKQSI